LGSDTNCGTEKIFEKKRRETLQNIAPKIAEYAKKYNAALLQRTQVRRLSRGKF